jgi:hypothetical protein
MNIYSIFLYFFWGTFFKPLNLITNSKGIHTKIFLDLFFLALRYGLRVSMLGGHNSRLDFWWRLESVCERTKP